MHTPGALIRECEVLQRQVCTERPKASRVKNRGLGIFAVYQNINAIDDKVRKLLAEKDLEPEIFAKLSQERERHTFQVLYEHGDAEVSLLTAEWAKQGTLTINDQRLIAEIVEARILVRGLIQFLQKLQEDTAWNGQENIKIPA